MGATDPGVKKPAFPNSVPVRAQSATDLVELVDECHLGRKERILHVFDHLGLDRAARVVHLGRTEDSDEAIQKPGPGCGRSSQDKEWYVLGSLTPACVDIGAFADVLGRE